MVSPYLDDYDRHAARVLYGTGRFTVEEVAYHLHRGLRFVRTALAGQYPRRKAAPARKPEPAPPAGSAGENPA